MIENFKHKGLRQLFEDDNARGVNAEHVTKLKVILTVMNTAREVGDLDVATFRLHALTGNLKGFWSITVRANWRVIFRFEDGRAQDVDFVDYHLGAYDGMKNPLHPGLVIRESLDELGLSVSEAAKGLGISRQQLHNLIAGRSAVGPEIAVRLEMALGSSADNWLRMQAAHDLAEVRRAGLPTGVTRFEPAA